MKMKQKIMIFIFSINISQPLKVEKKTSKSLVAIVTAILYTVRSFATIIYFVCKFFFSARCFMTHVNWNIEIRDSRSRINEVLRHQFFFQCNSFSIVNKFTQKKIQLQNFDFSLIQTLRQVSRFVFLHRFYKLKKSRYYNCIWIAP